ncbi:MAG: ABC transporter permease [Clostridiales bacterium]|nr:ABC transporter permease [Clostridiales bacterium]
MRFLDLLSMSISSLFRRKLRTILTVLGVMIGTASIVVMVSLGLGLNKTTMDQIKEQGGLTAINVHTSFGYPMPYMEGKSSMGNVGGDSEQVQLDEANLALIAAIPHVEIVSPVLNYSVLAKQGSYEGYLSFRGMTLEALEKLDIPLAEGRLPLPGNTEVEMVMGNQMIYNFYDTRNTMGYYDPENLPDIDFMNSPLFVIYDMDAYYNSQGGHGPMPKKYLVNTSGLVAGAIDEYNQHSYSVYVDIEALEFQLKKIFKNKAIPGQPTTPGGKPYKELIYNEAYVQVDDMKNVKDVQKQIIDMGFQANSSIEFLDFMEEQSRTIQAVLGGIGGVSLFVAAIGIANTMMMSIYERTKEIGIIKVLGCSLSNIRSLFLLEAGFIGFIGGVFGIGISLAISWVINSLLGADMYGMGTQSTISYIPPWLALLGLSFSVFVGMVAGFFPALRAMKLSPLAAIRSQ